MKKIICFFILIIVFTAVGTIFYLDKIESKRKIRLQRETQILEEEKRAEEKRAEELADDTAKYYFKYRGKIYKKDRWMLYDDIFK